MKYIREPTWRAIPHNRVFELDELGPWQREKLPRDKIVVVQEAWQSEKFFGRYREELMSQFVPKESVKDKASLGDLVRNITGTESVAVHVRRRDFQVQEIGRAHV